MTDVAATMLQLQLQVLLVLPQRVLLPHGSGSRWQLSAAGSCPATDILADLDILARTWLAFKRLRSTAAAIVTSILFHRVAIVFIVLHFSTKSRGHLWVAPHFRLFIYFFFCVVALPASPRAIARQGCPSVARTSGECYSYSYSYCYCWLDSQNPPEAAPPTEPIMAIIQEPHFTPSSSNAQGQVAFKIKIHIMAMPMPVYQFPWHQPPSAPLSTTLAPTDPSDMARSASSHPRNPHCGTTRLPLQLHFHCQSVYFKQLPSPFPSSVIIAMALTQGICHVPRATCHLPPTNTS